MIITFVSLNIIGYIYYFLVMNPSSGREIHGLIDW